MTKSTRWAMVIALVAITGMAMVLAFVLSLSGQSSGAFERHFVWLFWLNVAVAVLLLVVVAIATLRLVVRLRRGKFGSRLLTKLAGIFALVGLLPGLLIYTVSYQFVSRSIEAWFDVKVARALDAGLALGKGTLDGAANDLGERTRNAAQRLGQSGALPGAISMETLREQMGASEVAIISAGGQVLMSASIAADAPNRPSTALMRQARIARVATVIEGLDEDPVVTAVRPLQVRVKSLARISSMSLSLDPENDRFLLTVQPLGNQIAANALAVQAAYSEYQQRALASESLRRMYIGTLTLALVLAVFFAVLLAAILGNQLVRPLLLLADGVRQVAGGDLSAKPVFASRDELGGLTRSFAEMTNQLSQARTDVQRGVGQLESARARLQTILDNLTAGVILFDREGRIDTVNPGATRILRLPLSAYRMRPLAEVPGLSAFDQQIQAQFERHANTAEGGDRLHWQDAVELRIDANPALTLLVRGAQLPGDARLLLFDDISEIVSAQRSAAWAEVARRLAHEIKNPLTPIQLSAERLRHKLHARLDPADQALLDKSVHTIVNQVQAMKQLVNEFRDYGRLPAAALAPLDLNGLVTEVLALYGNAQEQGTLKPQLEAELPALMGDASQLRQVIHNLVQNALDSVADVPGAMVRVLTEARRNGEGQTTAVRLVITDNGPGFDAEVLSRAFEPYVTTKSKGTGLGLAVVKKIADEHRAQVRLSNRSNKEAGSSESGMGAIVSISFSLFAPSPPAGAPLVSTA
jgi:nitrogen fixation/metabolism regulation signal transduction histidine kinase